jgi:hypothetical protein
MYKNELLNDLQNYMTTNTFIQKYNKPICFKNNYNIDLHNIKSKSLNLFIKNEKIQIKTNIGNDAFIKQTNIENKSNDIKNNYSPNEKDKLFWCFYIFINGYEKYELDRTSSFKIEKEFKFMIAEKLISLKNELKQMGLKKNDISAELTNNTCISIKSLLVLCHIYKIKLLYVKNNYYYLSEPDNTGEEKYPLKCILHENDKIYIKDIDDNKDEQDKMLLYYHENYWKIENINKPIKSISSYSLLELQDICKKIKLPIEYNSKKLLKKDLYESIVKVF